MVLMCAGAPVCMCMCACVLVCRVISAHIHVHGALEREAPSAQYAVPCCFSVFFLFFVSTMTTKPTTKNGGSAL